MAKKKAKNTVNVEAVKRDVNKFAKDMAKNAPDAQGNIELPAGSVKRESPLEQQMGSSKYKDMIHGHNEKNAHILDRLPFTFPKKKKIRSHLDVIVSCEECGHQIVGSENTVAFTCPTCHKYVQAINPEAEKRGYDPSLKVGMFGTASDKLRLKDERNKKKK